MSLELTRRGGGVRLRVCVSSLRRLHLTVVTGNPGYNDKQRQF